MRVSGHNTASGSTCIRVGQTMSCSGMQETLSWSPEYDPQSQLGVPYLTACGHQQDGCAGLHHAILGALPSL